MNLLLDTHVLLWWLDGNAALSRRVRRHIANSTAVVMVSAASIWEIATKARIGKLPHALSVARRMPEILAEQGFVGLAITASHAQRAGWLPGPHRDPFDRMLVAQAQEHDLALASQDAALSAYNVRIIW
jgi:PIN domain nuclease of toxin-antitoxin system